jgi:nicotinamidase/pyrazinamidase
MIREDEMERNAALLIVDVQNDFCPNGALHVPDGDRVVAPINRGIDRFRAEGLPILASRDWHPPVTKHFQEQGGRWPVHCVRETPGAAFHPDLELPPDVVILSKGTDPDRDSYSAFDGTTADGMLLEQFLEMRGIEHLYIGGLATDYCVKATALEGLLIGKKVTILTDAIAGVELEEGDSERALAAIRQAGGEFLRVEELW